MHNITPPKPVCVLHLEDVNDGGDSGDITSSHDHLIATENVIGQLQELAVLQHLEQVSQ